MKAKDWAVSQGLAKPGRGRMPREAHEAIQKAIAGGMTFSDYKGAPLARGEGTRAVVIKKDEESAPVIVRTPDTHNYSDGFERYPRDQKFEGWDSQGKRHIVGVAAGCKNSRYSIMGCGCTGHVVLLNSMEWIKVKPIGE